MTGTAAQEPVLVLMIEDDEDYATVLQSRLRSDVKYRFSPVHARTLEEGLRELGTRPVGLVLLDLSLPDSRGMETFSRVRARAPLVPVVILSGIDDESIALDALKAGAQDYIIKGQVDGKFLTRILNYNLERSRLQMELQRLSLVDPLTGLYNRRGFTTLAAQHLKLASRSKRGFGIFSIDVDGLKKVNDRDGHAAGDRLLTDVAGVLTSAFRGSDIVARMGGDEFAVMAMDLQKEHLPLLEARLAERLRRRNADVPPDQAAGFSAGSVYFDPAGSATLEDLLERADRLMYEKKRSARAPEA
jgi:two-component system cell cycle response regulator